jgi:hypothetical protein
LLIERGPVKTFRVAAIHLFFGFRKVRSMMTLSSLRLEKFCRYYKEPVLEKVLPQRPTRSRVASHAVLGVNDRSL